MPKGPQLKQELGQTLMLMAMDFQQRLDSDLGTRGVQGIGARHRAVFLFLGRNGASRAVELAEAAGIRPQSMMKIVHELESLGLVERSEDPTDSRAKLIDFTAKGRKLIAELSRSTETVWQQYARILGRNTLTQTVHHLNTLLQAGEKTVADKVAFITGASRGIGAESAVALARAGYRVAITARTLTEGESHDHVGSSAALPGSLATTATAVKKVGGEALCLRGDILDSQSMVAAAEAALQHFGRIDVLFNNAVYQGTGNIEPLLEVAEEQLRAIYQGNVFTPLALVKTIVPGMIKRGSGTVLNMVSHSAFTDPPAAADKGGWGFAYPSSKAALSRMAGSLRAEHPASGLRVFNLEPGLVMTEVMRLAGIDDAVMARFKPCTPAAIAAVVSWLADNDPLPEWDPQEILRGPAIAKALNLLKSPSLVET